jgi:hypothetical protein
MASEILLIINLFSNGINFDLKAFNVRVQHENQSKVKCHLWKREFLFDLFQKKWKQTLREQISIWYHRIQNCQSVVYC